MMHETYIALFQTQSGFTKETTKTKKNSSPLLKGTISSSSEIVSNFKEVCYEGLLDLDSSEWGGVSNVLGEQVPEGGSCDGEGPVPSCLLQKTGGASFFLQADGNLSSALDWLPPTLSPCI